MLCCNIADKFLNKNCLTNSGTTKQTNLTTLCIRCQKVNYLDTCLKNLFCRILFFKCWRFSVDFPLLLCVWLLSTINSLS